MRLHPTHFPLRAVGQYVYRQLSSSPIIGPVDGVLAADLAWRLNRDEEIRVFQATGDAQGRAFVGISSPHGGGSASPIASFGTESLRGKPLRMQVEVPPDARFATLYARGGGIGRGGRVQVTFHEGGEEAEAADTTPTKPDAV